ncbi:AP-3 complex subunit delta [Pseudogymnoascus destructans]|uniref:AP-3 complex subunit delta n=2 Tax=Pseudogymnoascus destructans TaxID=655981 RepID=L8FU63_PSED2|nr:AP-3 complex subunit delta [Pseudogymnoascus destructans]ELR04013.1 hypothetical protein GMDG_06528 [Pseudogymnoascus destructans 20631-21]OAF60026.1 AP-3 complex subunit delta [Pseudogymnoascus destructans]
MMHPSLSRLVGQHLRDADNVLLRFEKSLYDLIRGLRNHKGNEKAYIQNSLKECRAEIRGQDMDVKATALLKLVYLEMFGHDMSWASFHVLEVMSSAKYIQKRVGYLGAVQSFRPDTEVLMLATNLLKKDIVSASLTTMSLPIITLPHIITSSLAMSVLSDLLPRLTHSSPTVRKKTIVTIYRLALVYPETLRPAWPRIKERLMDDNEDSSVTAAIVNVICELGWRRPQDFLPLAPRLFELLVDGGNNWMAIKLIKLFATMTPLEPRLVKKLLPPLTSIIRTTPAMSLLYECINGIIQGGILGGTDNESEDEIATLCVTKLRGMIMVEGDPNLKYVALLAFNQIVLTHPYLVSQQEDVIMDCIDSPDMSIRLRALDLVVGMVSSDNLMSIVGRLMRQLRSVTSTDSQDSGSPSPAAFDSDEENPGVNMRSNRNAATYNLPDDYRNDVILRILKMCSSSNYNNLVDFEWYIDILIQLARNAPRHIPTSAADSHTLANDSGESDVAENIGNELRNVAVKVKAIRASATRAAESIIVDGLHGAVPQIAEKRGILRPVTWVVGEYAPYLSYPEDVLVGLLHFTKPQSDPEVLAMTLQAIPKVFAHLSGNESMEWSAERKTMLSLLMARILHTMEPLALHPNLEVQERTTEFVELLRLAAEASAGQEASSTTDQYDAPLLLTQAIPSLFAGLDLHSIAPGAQSNVPMPANLNLDQPITANLNELLRGADSGAYERTDEDEFQEYYHQRPSTLSLSMADPAINRLAETPEEKPQSYQRDTEDTYLDPDIVARRRAERLERNKDDPFYIAGISSESSTSTPFDTIIRNGNGNDLDIDSIPIMQLDLGNMPSVAPEQKPKKRAAVKPRQRIQVSADETLAASGSSTPRNDDSEASLEGQPRARTKPKRSPLLVDSSNIGEFVLEGDDNVSGGSAEYEHHHDQKEEEEMAKAMQEIEKLRLEMQRANERIQAAQGVPPEGTVVKKKTKKKVKAVGDEATGKVPSKKKAEQADGSAEVTTVKKKRKKVKAKEPEAGGIEADAEKT